MDEDKEIQEFLDELAELKENAKLLAEDYKMQFVFYHGSHEKYPELLPVSPNMGNRWEPPKWVTYMWKEKENAIKWGMQRAIRKNPNKVEPDNIIVIGKEDQIQLYTLKTKEQMIRQTAVGLAFYVYTLQIKPETLGVGHASGLDEYTSTDPHPKILKTEKYIITDKMITQYITFVNQAEYDIIYKSGYENTRGLLGELMYDQKEIFDKEAFVLNKLRSKEIKPGSDLEMILKSYR